MNLDYLLKIVLFVKKSAHFPLLSIKRPSPFVFMSNPSFFTSSKGVLHAPVSLVAPVRHFLPYVGLWKINHGFDRNRRRIRVCLHDPALKALCPPKNCRNDLQSCYRLYFGQRFCDRCRYYHGVFVVVVAIDEFPRNPGRNQA